MLNHFRNLLIYQVSKGDLALVEASEQDVASFAEQSPKIATDALARIMEVLTDCESRLRDAGVVGVGNSPAEFAAMLPPQAAKWQALSKTLGIKFD